MPVVSVIVPVYNVEPYVNRCIDSILRQSFTDFELILVDDGTPDRSGEICDESAFNDNGIITVHKPNGGVSSARNIAVLFAVGEYITFVDSDDWIENDMLHKMYNAINISQADIAVCGYRYINLDGSTVLSYKPKESIMTNIEALEYYANVNNSVIQAPWNKCIKRQIVLENPFPIGRRYGEDFATVYKWIYDCYSVISIESELYNYYYSETGISRNDVPWIDNLATFDELIEFCKIHKLKKLELLFAMERIEFDYWTHDQINDCKIKNLLRNDIKKYLKKYGMSIHYFPLNKLEIYEMAFPRSMKIYCHIFAMHKMIKEKGLLFTINRLLGRCD